MIAVIGLQTYTHLHRHSSAVIPFRCLGVFVQMFLIKTYERSNPSFKAQLCGSTYFISKFCSKSNSLTFFPAVEKNYNN